MVQGKMSARCCEGHGRVDPVHKLDVETTCALPAQWLASSTTTCHHARGSLPLPPTSCKYPRPSCHSGALVYKVALPNPVGSFTINSAPQQPLTRSTTLQG